MKLLLALLLTNLIHSYFGLEEKKLSRKRQVFVTLDRPSTEDSIDVFEMSAEEQAKLDRFLQTMISLSFSMTTPSLLPSLSPTTTASSTQPTLVPTGSASAQPNGASKLLPSASPTLVPTRSNEPSVAASLPLTGAPTKTKLPTPVPTGSPTGSPTRSPTESPTESPTGSLLPAPTVLPTLSPTTEPTKSPTRAPSISPEPTPAPTIFPTRTQEPTLAPSRSPTQSPTSILTKSPTSAPTDSPSKFPTRAPTKSPTSAPTASPSKSPTRAPTKSPTASPTVRQFESNCRDDPDFYHEIEEITCSYIDEIEERRELYCKNEEVYVNCPRTCGECCKDAKFKQFFFIVREQKRGCNWIKRRKNRPNLYCSQEVTGRKVRDYCPDACGICRNIITQPTPTPVAFCKNDDEWTFFNSDVVTCRWIRHKEFRRVEYCSKGPVVTDFCPQSCGHSCEDHPTFMFKNNFIQKDITCAYISFNDKRRNKYCSMWKNGTVVRDMCPVACNACLEKVRPTSPPSIENHQLCFNNPDWHWPNMPSVTCKWIRNKEFRRQSYCRIGDTTVQCPQTCGICCEDDRTYSIDKKGLKTCHWVSQTGSRINTFCPKFRNGRLVKDACPKTCDVCLDTVL